MDPGDSENVYRTPRLQHPNFTLKLSYLKNLYIFGIPRVHTLTLCIWFSRHIARLTLPVVKTPRERVSGPSFVKVCSLSLSLYCTLSCMSCCCSSFQYFLLKGELVSRALTILLNGIWPRISRFPHDSRPRTKICDVSHDKSSWMSTVEEDG